MRHRTLIIGLLALLMVSCTAAWKYLPHRLSYDECGDVYRHFVDMQLSGVRVTYVRDKVVNDTLRLPVTLLEAENDEGWEVLDNLFGRTRHIEEILKNPDLPDSVKHEFLDYPYSFYGYRAHRETPETNIDSDNNSADDLFVYVFLNQRCVTIYEPADPKNDCAIVSGRAIRSLKEIKL